MTKTWFLTGTSTGFGRELTEQLLARGDRVVATLRDPERLDALRSAHGDRLRVARLDVTRPADVRRVVDESFAALGRIDVIVSNAGHGLFGPAEELTDDDIERQVATNLLGSMHVIRAALPHLRAQRGGRIVQVSSAGGQTTYPGFSAYHATKWGIEGFCETVAQEVAPFGIELTIVEPGASRTSFGASLAGPPPSAAYDPTPVGDVRRAIASGAFAIDGDPVKMVRAILDSAEQSPAPRRLALGRDTYRDVRASLTARLAEVESQRDLAESMGVEP